MTQKKKNILMLCSWYPNRVHPDLGIFIKRHIQCLDDAVNKSVMAVVEDPNMTGKWFEIVVEEEKKNNLHSLIYFRQTNFPFLKFFLKFIAYCKGYFFLRQKVEKFDLIHAHVFIDAGFYAWLIGFFSRTPYVVTEHSTLFMNNNLQSLPKSVRFLLKKVANNSRFILPVSNFLKEHIQKTTINSPFLVIPNVVNTELFIPKGRIAKLPYRFLHVSGFQDFKNVPGILRAVKKLSAVRTDFRMTIAGDGKIQPLRELAESLNISSSLVRFKGRMNEKEVATTMQNHDCFVFFSNYETFGVVLIEALASGLPVIATQVPCIMDIVNSENLGKLIPIQDETDLANAMTEMIDQRDFYQTTTLRKRAVDHYSKEVVKKQLLEVYDKI
jgi:glycosyltransferase involved in cell wall biosynthesis